MDSNKSSNIQEVAYNFIATYAEAAHAPAGRHQGNDMAPLPYSWSNINDTLLSNKTDET